MRNVTERVARLEKENEQCAKERADLLAAARVIDALQRELASLTAWRARVVDDIRWYRRAAMWGGLMIASQYVSGGWASLLGGFARLFAPA